jgi:alpha,alpha-trehalose-phosphate synthase [UDP-forming]
LRLSLRLIVCLMLSVALVSLLFSGYQVRLERRSQRQELERRAQVLAESLEDNVETLLENGSSRSMQHLVERFANREHLIGLAIYDKDGTPLAVTPALKTLLVARPAAVDQAIAQGHEIGTFQRTGANYLQVSAVPLRNGNETVGGLAVIFDARYIETESARAWHDSFLHLLVQVFLVSLITLVVVRWSVEGPIAHAAQWMKALRAGRVTADSTFPGGDLFRPLAKEVANLAESLTAARKSAEKEASLREASESLWTAERLAVHVRARLQGSRLFVVSNREPYIHSRQNGSLQVIVPASGLVTALEPILRVCEGTWIAHGNGDADRETVDRHDRLRVPPEEPRYTLRRVWLNKEEEEGYYYGLANEGIWPLCHIAHTRPIFRATDWEMYRNVNQKFAKAVLEEMAETENPVVLVQDYHFALLPALIKKQRPDARVAIFWHIPWPNPEAFGICPWQEELLDGLLGSDLVGFHVQAHCNNFLQTVDRALESRVDWERFAVNRQDHITAVRPFPISVEFKEGDTSPRTSSHYEERVALLKQFGVEAVFMGVGVDRVDYTKGILERFLAIERLLEEHAAYRGRFTFVQIGAPSRTHIKRYRDLLTDVEAEADRINWRFQSDGWKPIVFLKGQHSHDEIQKFYRAADICLVTSLHDGMNLVAKEFVAARGDEQGVLVLSRFAGASRELSDALLVNPYDIEQVAQAIHVALKMPAEERTTRMQHLRRVVREQNIYRWAATLLSELGEIRLESNSIDAALARNSRDAAPVASAGPPHFRASVGS